MIITPNSDGTFIFPNTNDNYEFVSIDLIDIPNLKSITWKITRGSNPD